MNQNIINLRLVKRLLYILSFLSFFLLIFMQYDRVFKVIIVLPVIYCICLLLFVYKSTVIGLASEVLVLVYGFRMCVLPVLCAYGNFYIEPAGKLWKGYFGQAVFLMGLENIIVFGSLYYISKYKLKKNSLRNSDNDTIVIFAGKLIFMTILLMLLTNRNFIHLFYFITDEAQNSTMLSYNEQIKAFQNVGTFYYIFQFLLIIGRPLISFLLVSYFLKKEKLWANAGAYLIAFLNVVLYTDRRIASMLVGGVCLLYIISYKKKKQNQWFMYIFIVVLLLLTIIYCFYGEDTPARIARKFQRYFSGPALMAIGIGVFWEYRQGPLIFLKRLLNDSFLYTGLFDAIQIKDYTFEYCRGAGKSVWTPMTIGAIQYFYILAPVLLVLIVYFIVFCDKRSIAVKSHVNKLILNYLGISTAIYMVMYSLELIYYNMIFIGGFYMIIFYISAKIRIVKYKA